MPKISVVLPVYNGAQYLGTAIESVLSQSFADWELLIVDDGSTDATPEILAQFHDPRIHARRQANAGEAGARNTALAYAQGEYIAFLDADDLYLPGAFDQLAAFLDQHPDLGVVFADGDVIDAQGRKLMTLTEHRPAICTGNILEAIVLDAAILTVPVCTMVRHSAIRQANARFDTTLIFGTDWDFWIQLARHCHFGYLNQRTCAYRVHHSNITTLGPRQQRRHDLVGGRKKVMESGWFESLRLETRYRFLYHLVVLLLAEQPAEQRALLQTAQVQALPRVQQAALWRQASMQWLRQGDLPAARSGLAAARQIAPGETTTRMLLWLTNLGAAPARIVFDAWQQLGQLRRRVRQRGAKRSRPMPHQFTPARGAR